MEKEARKSLRCPVCLKGRIVDSPAEAIMSQYRLFAMGKDDSADLIAKCPKCGTQIGIVILYRPPLPVAAAVQCGISRKI